MLTTAAPTASPYICFPLTPLLPEKLHLNKFKVAVPVSEERPPAIPVLTERAPPLPVAFAELFVKLQSVTLTVDPPLPTHIAPPLVILEV